MEKGVALSARSSIGTATAWIDRHVARLGAEEIRLAGALGRVLAQEVAAAEDLPPCDRAAVDGLAVLADETAGASAYNPLGFRLAAAGAALAPNTGRLLNAGEPLPEGADAVLPLAYVEASAAGRCEIIEAVSPGFGVERQGVQWMRGLGLLRSGRLLRPQDIGLLAAAGALRLRVYRRPRVQCLLPAWNGAAPAGEERDVNGPLLHGLIERDGGIVTDLRHVERNLAAIGEALSRAADADLILIAGGTGPGANDASAQALRASGELAIHGVALRPGETAGLGRTGAGLPVFLLPGAPSSCLWAYEFLAGRAIRRCGGRNPALPFPVRAMTADRKIVSDLGMTEICPVHCVGDDRIEAVPAFAETGLAALAAADGFVILAEGSEGVAQGSRVDVYWHEEDGSDWAGRGAETTG